MGDLRSERGCIPGFNCPETRSFCVGVFGCSLGLPFGGLRDYGVWGFRVWGFKVLDLIFFSQGFWVYILSLRDIGVSGEMAEPPELLHRTECS